MSVTSPDKHAGFAGFGVVGFAIRRWEWMTALGTVRVAASDQGVTLLAFFRRRFLVRASGFVLGFDLVDRSVAFDVAAEVEDQAVLFVGMQTKAAADALVEQSRRHRWTQHHDAIDTRCIEAGRQNVDVAEKTQRFVGQQRCRGIATEAGQQLVAFIRRRFVR